MPSNRVLRVRSSVPPLGDGVAALQRELELPGSFPDEVLAAAQAAAAAPRLPDLDRTDLPFVTIDPEGARDLDQALHLDRDADGYVVHYAIADVAAFVSPGDPIDREAHRRGETLYGADAKIPLHPAVLSEDAASLLAGQVRPALLWTLRLGPDGSLREASVERARVRSTRQLAYDEVQALVGTPDEPVWLRLLGEVGRLRQEREAERGGISLALPEQEVDVADGRWSLAFRRQSPVEEWNAQISLMTGFAAAEMMLRAGVGLLRTLPPADPRDVERLRRTAAALGLRWPDDVPHPELIRALDPDRPADAAMLVACTRLLRGSGYTAFDGEAPMQAQHAALAAAYAHATAPLRRLGDRYVGEVCLAICADVPVPDWARQALPALPDELAAAGRRASAYERGLLDLVEAAVLAGRVGERWHGTVVDVRDDVRGTVMIADPAVEARVDAAPGARLPLGEAIEVELVEADPARRTVRFAQTSAIG